MSGGELAGPVLAAILGPFAALVIVFIGHAVKSSNRGHDQLRAHIRDLSAAVRDVASMVDALHTTVSELDRDVRARWWAPR